MRSYPSQEFAMQYEESIYDYILWRMEEQGAYFYFSPEGDKVIFADTPKSHDASAATVFYSPATGLENNHREEVISSFSLSQTPLPRQVVVRSYDWKNPRKLIVGEAEVSATGIGDVYLTHENVESDSEAERIAAIRAEELVCRSRIFTGTGSVPILRPGVTFTLDRHYNPAFNRDYRVLGHHARRRSGSLSEPRPRHSHAQCQGAPLYHNTFSCIESDVPYRPERTAKRAKVSGVIRAFVDGAGSGSRAEMDEYGRYKLLFPFDVSGRKQGNASCWIRMAQPQVGKDSGLSLPLLPGVEVIVSFIDGNPDRPVITGALPNGETGVITGSGNNNFSGIRTPGGNQITINDTDTHQGISLISASGNGLTMTSGSADSSTSTTDTQVSMASIGMAEVASVFKSTATGYKVTQSAACGEGPADRHAAHRHQSIVLHGQHSELAFGKKQQRQDKRRAQMGRRKFQARGTSRVHGHVHQKQPDEQALLRRDDEGLKHGFHLLRSGLSLAGGADHLHRFVVSDPGRVSGTQHYGYLQLRIY